MKKITLFGILALSTVAFGAPAIGDSASVPVTVKAVVTKAPSGLAIVDEVTGQVDQITIDHGTLKKGTITETSPSIQTKGFRVVRITDDGTTLEPLGASKMSVGISTKSTTLRKLGSAVPTDTLSSNLEVYPKTGTLTTKSPTNPAGGATGMYYTVDLDKAATEHRGEIRSIITSATGTEGVYDNIAEGRPTLAVRIDAI